MDTQTVSASIADALRGGDFRSASWAGQVLGMSVAGLRDLVRTGSLDAIVVDGVYHFEVEQVTARVAEQADETLNIDVEIRELLTGLLTAYLDANPVTALWELARRDGRPMVSNRRGAASTWRRFGPEFHTIAVDGKVVYRWGLEHRAAMMAKLPSVNAVVGMLTRLPGVETLRWVTALAEPGVPHRLSGWLRVDPLQWRIGLDDDARVRVMGPSGADYVSGTAHMVSQ